MIAPEFTARRRNLRLTQAALAAHLGVTVQTISNYETGRNPIPGHFALALRALAMDMDDRTEDERRRYEAEVRDRHAERT